MGPATVVYEMGVRRLKAELWNWYSAEEKHNRFHTRLTALVPSMLGTYAEQAFKIHGVETNGLLFFCFRLFDKFGHSLGKQLPVFRRAASALRTIVEHIRNKERLWPASLREVLR